MMDGSGALTVPWAGDDRRFLIGIDQLRELEGHTNVGALLTYQRVVSGEAKEDEYRTIIRLGLLGGGMQQSEVSALLKVFCDGAKVSLRENRRVAQLVLLAGITGPPRERKPGKAKAEPSAPDASTSPPSTAPES